MADRRHRRRNGESRSVGRETKPIRGLSILPSLFTIGNIFCAYYSVMSTLNGKYDQAALAIGVGYVLDGLDGRVARVTGTSTEFGAQLDSLADVLTFGIAPAILAFSWGIDWMSGNPALHTTPVESLRTAHSISGMDRDLCVCYLRCASARAVQCASSKARRRRIKTVFRWSPDSGGRRLDCFDCAFLANTGR
jgi:hypothetical protein